MILICFYFPPSAIAHPGIGIVKDGRNNIYYSDLQHVWKISKGVKTIAVPHVHTHELYIDSADNLYGQNEIYQPASERFYHYLWRLNANGKFDTVMQMQEAYIMMDFALARDINGNEYYTKQFLKKPDTLHIYKKQPNGKETIFARGAFKGVNWLHPQRDGSLLFVKSNHVYKATPQGKVILIAQQIANSNPSFHFSGKNPTAWGIWQDAAHNIYVAVFSDQAVKKIAANGEVSLYYQSTGNWAPTHGVFDNEGHMWLLEASHNNEIRVIKATPTTVEKRNYKTQSFFYIGLSTLTIALAALLYWQHNSKLQQP